MGPPTRTEPQQEKPLLLIGEHQVWFLVPQDSRELLAPRARAGTREDIQEAKKSASLVQRHSTVDMSAGFGFEAQICHCHC